MKNILAVAPHPDDETLGCGGALMRHKAAGDEIHWLIVTAMTKEAGFSAAQIKTRRAEIGKVAKLYGFKSVHQLGFRAAGLDAVPLHELIEKMGRAFSKISPSVVYLPYHGDAHSDHKIVFTAGAACAKSFRRPSVRRLLAYETLSETDFGVDPAENSFRPNLFVDISAHLDHKIKIMREYAGELGEFPFPRSETAIRSCAHVRGAAAGCAAAEAFVILKEIA